MVKINGGKVIASGGYGCVFMEALKCKGSSKRQRGKISKLMTIKHSESEYDEINNRTQLNPRPVRMGILIY